MMTKMTNMNYFNELRSNVIFDLGGIIIKIDFNEAFVWSINFIDFYQLKGYQELKTTLFLAM